MLRRPSEALLQSLEARLGPSGFTCDPAGLAPWLRDWRGRYSGAAAAMVSPATVDEVQAVVAACAEAQVAVVPQGGNTSMVGGATPPPDGEAILLSMRRMKRIRSLSPEDNVAVAEAGVILADLQAGAREIGRRFPLDLGAKGSATIGGLVSTNAGGTQVLRFGPMRSLVAGIEAVLPDGSRFDGLSALRKDNRGYDPKQLLIGAEGTLGVVTAASLRLVPVPGSTAVAWVGIRTPGEALALLRRLEGELGESVESFELVPADALDLVLHAIPGTRPPLEAAHSWHVLVEIAVAPGQGEASDRLQAALAGALSEGLIEDAVLAASSSQAAELWRLRESIAEAERHRGPAAKHDISVPVAAMPDFIDQARRTVETRFAGARVIAFGHLGDGNVHFNVQAPPGTDAAAWLAGEGEAVTCLVHDLVGTFGGSISAEHGVGQMKLAELQRTADPARLAFLRAVKRALDPGGIMNPGKLIVPEP